MDPRKDMAVGRLLALTDEAIREQKPRNRALVLEYLSSIISATEGREDDPRYLMLRIQCVDRMIKLLLLLEPEPVEVVVDVVADVARTRLRVAAQLDELESRMRPVDGRIAP